MSKDKTKKLPNIGGQAVMEGVMMRNGSRMATTVQQSKGKYTMKVVDGKTEETGKPWYKKTPFIRGVVNFVAMLKVGITSLNDSVKMIGLDEEEPSKFENWISEKTGKNAMDVATSAAMFLGVCLSVFLFIIVPNLLTTWIAKSIESSLVVNLVEGFIRITIFTLYLLGISQMKDIKRFFGYHGAEHKTINAFEAREKLTIENVQSKSTAHPRCGTSFLVFVLLISIIVFSLTGWSGQLWWQRLLMRIALLPVVASIAYELLMGIANSNSLFVRILRWPGMQVQKLTTKEPTDEMVVTAIASALAVMDEENYNNSVPQGYEYPPIFDENASKEVISDETVKSEETVEKTEDSETVEEIDITQEVEKDTDEATTVDEETIKEVDSTDDIDTTIETVTGTLEMDDAQTTKDDVVINKDMDKQEE